MNQLIEQELLVLASTRWFSRVGQTLENESRVRRAGSWPEAFQWCEQPISWWCNVEAGLQLFNQLRISHYDRFAKWNVVARSLLPQVVQLVERNVLPAVPGVTFPRKAQEWIQATVLSYLLELSFRDCVTVEMFVAPVRFFLAGYFPCGWWVESPDRFPTESVLAVF